MTVHTTVTKDADASDTVLAKFPRADGEIRVSLRSFKGATFLDVRQHFTSGSGEILPTRKGCTVKVSELPAFADAVAEARKLAAASGAR